MHIINEIFSGKNKLKYLIFRFTCKSFVELNEFREKVCHLRISKEMIQMTCIKEDLADTVVDHDKGLRPERCQSFKVYVFLTKAS